VGEQGTMRAGPNSRTTPSTAVAIRLSRGRPRAFAEWQALRRWGKLPPWERQVAGYLLRNAREAAGLTQRELAGLLGGTQQAVAQAERWTANPTVAFVQRWATACGAHLEIALVSGETGPVAAQPPPTINP
jgi:DNA-binding XRE family transcriptional regulator